jgi:osmoprotectant transport system substrate-binding protein
MIGRRLFGFMTVAGLATFAMGGAAQAQQIVVGGKGFTEQLLIAEMTSQLLKANGFTPDKRTGMGSAVLRKAMESNQVDLCWEYTGTSLITYNKITDRLSSEDTYKRVKQVDGEKGLVWLDPSKANNTYAIAMTKDGMDQAGIKTLSDFAKAVNAGKAPTIAMNAEFAGRPDGLPGLEKEYGFKMPLDKVKKMDTGLTYQALRDKQVDSTLVFATDGRVAAFDFVILKDDKGFFPPYSLTPVVRKEVLDKNPKLAPALNKLSAKLDDATMAKLNAMIDVDKKSVEEVSSAFLKQNGLI